MMPTYVFYNDLGLLNSLKAFIIPALLGQGLKAQIFMVGTPAIIIESFNAFA